MYSIRLLIYTNGVKAANSKQNKILKNLPLYYMSIKNIIIIQYDNKNNKKDINTDIRKIVKNILIWLKLENNY